MRDLNVISLPTQLRTLFPSPLTWPLLALLGLALWAEPVLAQGHGQLPGPRAVPPPGMPGMPGTNPGGVQQPQRFVPGMADPNARGPVQEIKAPDPVKLPDNYAPPASKDPLMEIDRPLTAPDELEKLKKDIARYGTVLRTARSTDADKALIRNGIRYRLALMCLKEARSAAATKDLSKLHDDLLRDLASAAAAPDNPKPAEVRSFRQFVMQEVVNQAAPLLTTQNFYVRLHVAILLGELNLTEENTKLALKLEAFIPACEPLVQVLNDPKQPEAVKVAAVNGLVRIMRQGSPPVLIRTRIAEAIVAELKNEKAHPWYQMRLAGALASVDIDLDQARKPFVVDILKSVMGSDGRTWGVRAEAARSLGRVPLPPAANPPTITRAVAEFGLKLAKAAQQSPQQKADDPKWRGEFIKLYLAFQPLDASDTMANKTSKAGLLNNAAAVAKPAYDLIVPLVAAILHGQRLTVQQVNTLEAWVAPSPAASQPAQSSTQQRTAPVEVSSPASVRTGGPN